MTRRVAAVDCGTNSIRLLRSCLGLRTHQPVESDEVRDHQHWHVDDRNDVGSAELPCQRRQTAPDGVVVGLEEIDGSDEIPTRRVRHARRFGMDALARQDVRQTDPAANTLTRTSSAFGAGISSSMTVITSGPP